MLPVTKTRLWGVKLKNLTIDGRGRAAYGLYLKYVHRMTRENVRVINVKSAGMYLNQCWVADDNKFSVGAFDGTYGAVTVLPTNGVVLEGCTCQTFHSINIDDCTNALVLTNSHYNGFFGGTLERVSGWANPGSAVQLYDARYNSFIALDAEGWPRGSPVYYSAPNANSFNMVFNCQGLQPAFSTFSNTTDMFFGVATNYGTVPAIRSGGNLPLIAGAGRVIAFLTATNTSQVASTIDDNAFRPAVPILISSNSWAKLANASPEEICFGNLNGVPVVRWLDGSRYRTNDLSLPIPATPIWRASLPVGAPPGYLNVGLTGSASASNSPAPVSASSAALFNPDTPNHWIRFPVPSGFGFTKIRSTITLQGGAGVTDAACAVVTTGLANGARYGGTGYASAIASGLATSSLVTVALTNWWRDDTSIRELQAAIWNTGISGANTAKVWIVDWKVESIP